MGSTQERVFYYHSDATALGGHFRTPVRQMIPIQAPIALSPSGGYGSARSEKFRFEELISFEAAYTQVAGHRTEPHGDWGTLATSTIEGLNILDMITADKVVAHIATEHPRKPGLYEPTVSITGSRFENLKVAGCPVQIDIDQNLLSAGANAEGRQSSSKPLIENQSFLKKVERQYAQMADPGSLPEWVKEKRVPAWVAERYPARGFQSNLGQRGFVLCSLVSGTSGEFPGTPYGNVFDVPDFGKIFLGEVLVDRNTHRLIMVRLELGCSAEADVAGGSVSVEGRPHP